MSSTLDTSHVAIVKMRFEVDALKGIVAEKDQYATQQRTRAEKAEALIAALLKELKDAEILLAEYITKHVGAERAKSSPRLKRVRAVIAKAEGR